MPIDSKHPTYPEILERCCLVRDVLSGNVKSKRYIPDIDYRDQRRCSRHRQRGVLVEFTKRTLRSFIGLIFKTSPIVTVPPLLDYVNTDVTGNKLTIEQAAREFCREVFTAGSVGCLVDYPDVEEGVDQATQDKMNLKARMYMYVRESYGNWFTACDDGSDKLTLVVLREDKNIIDPADGYEWKTVIQYRVLRINEEGYYEVSIVNDKGIDQIDPYLPKANGAYLTEIPFFIAGAEINDINAENISPLQGLAELNIGHLRNSCDFEEAAFLVGQASLFFTSSITPSIMEDNLKKQAVTLGSNKGHYLGTAGTSWLLQAQETSMHTKGMEDKINQAVMIGASMLTQISGTVKTAEATRMDKGSEVSVIETVVNNVEDMMRLALKAQAQFMGADDADIDIEMNHEFIEITANPLVMAQLAAGVVQELWPKRVAQDYARDTGTMNTELTNEELDALVENEAPATGVSSLYSVKPSTFGTSK